MLKVNCLGGFEAWIDERPLTHFYSQKAKALLIYLAVEAKRPHDRSYLAGLLWPGYSEKRARRNLSQTLTSLRKDLGGKQIADSIISSTTHTIGLNHGDAISVDTLLFENIVTAVQKHPHPDPSTCLDCTTKLQEAIALYSGPFLDQFGSIDSADFEDWALARRERYFQQAVELFTQLTTNLVAQEKYEMALQVGQQLLHLAPWLESAHQQRMRLLAQLGHRVQALNQYDILTNVLMKELGVQPAPETDDLYDQILAGDIQIQEDASKPVHQSATPVKIPFQAPPPSPYFVGRTEEQAHLSDLLLNANDELKLVALVGMGGIGKTSLAAMTANELKEQFADGVLWSNLKVSGPATIIDVWAKAFGNDFSSISDLASKSAALRGLLADKETLIVLDNAENAADIRPLLPNNGRCAVLLTTRNLDVASALNADIIQIKGLTAVNGLDLLVQILGAERVHKTPAETEQAKKISGLLQHLPLAVEIAAQRLKSRPRMSLAALAARLEHTQQRLALEISDRAVRTSFQVSWEGLTPSLQQLFKAISIFQGRPFTVASIAHITNIDLFDTEDDIHTLSTLSMLQEEGENRYKQHRLLADFGSEQLNNEERVSLTTRMIAYTLEFAKTKQNNFNQLENESQNFDLAIEMAYSLELHQELVAFTDYLSKGWRALGHYSQARNAYALVDKVLQRSDDKKRATRNFLRWGEVCLEQNDYEEALQMLQRALALSTQLNDLNSIAQANYLLARIAIIRNQNEQALSLLMTCDQYFDQLNDQQGKANVLYQQGFIAETDKKIEKAQSYFDSSLKIYREIGDYIGEIDTLRMLAQIEFRKNNFFKAEKLALQAKAACERKREKALYASTLYLLTAVYRKQKSYDLAQAVGAECLLLLRQTGRQRTEGFLLRQLSLIQRDLGNYENALALVKQSSAIFQALTDHKANIVALRQMGDIYLLLDQPQSAEDVWQTAVGFAKQIQSDLLIETLNQRLS